MAIYLVTGKPRHGKTNFIVRDVVVPQILRGGRLFSNLKINLGVGALKKFDDSIVGNWYDLKDRDNPKKIIFYWASLHEWDHFKNGIIIADEFQRYANARQWELLSPQTELKLSQHGKDSLDIWGTVQNPERIDVIVRQLTEKFYNVKTVFGHPDNKVHFFGFKRFRIVRVDEDEDLRDFYQMQKHPDLKIEIDGMKVFHRWFYKKYAICYDTYQQVGNPELRNLTHTVLKCLEPGCDYFKTIHR